MTLRDLTRALAGVCLLVIPLSLGLVGCKKKPTASSTASPESKESLKKKSPRMRDVTLKRDATGKTAVQPTDAVETMSVKGVDSADPPLPLKPTHGFGEKPGMTRDGGVAVTKGHKGMLPMKGLVDPTD